jgi:SAM-dependent methyltransferase
MQRTRGDVPPPVPALHKTGSEGLDGNRGTNELRLLDHFGMTPSSDILDVGCGFGRLAYECASYLDDEATYTGFDIAPIAIDWLNTHYAPRLPGFRFDLLDVHNERYRPDGGVQEGGVRFPYEDDRYDVVCAFEVFMHLSLEGVRNYLHEIARVLRPGGLAVVTLVAIYPGEEELSHDGRAYVPIGEGMHTRFPRRTNLSMAYDLDVVRGLLTEAGLDEVDLIKGLVHIPPDRRPAAAWVGPRPLTHGCDLFATRKPAAASS